MIRAAIALAIAWAVAPAAATAADEKPMAWGCASAAYFGETTEYPHGVLGDAIEYKGLYSTWIENDDVIEHRFELPKGQVFEDVAPRCADFNGDGAPDPVTIISDAKGGARLAIFIKGKIAAQTPPIGRGNRWLAPVGIADLTGDGFLEVPYVEKPHLSGKLRIWSFREGDLVLIAEADGFSNHRIGEDYITGGIRDCGQGPEMVIPNFNWSRLMVVRYGQTGVLAQPLLDKTSRPAVANALKCKE